MRTVVIPTLDDANSLKFLQDPRGFMDAAFKWLVAFVAVQLFIIALGLLPLKLWRSFRVRRAAPSPGTGGTPQPAAS